MPEKQSATAPGPSSLYLLKNLGAAIKNPAQFLLSAHTQFGDVVRIQFAGITILYSTRHPEQVHEILAGGFKKFRKSNFFKIYQDQMGQGLITSDGALWETQRRLIQPYMRYDKLGDIVDGMIAVTSEKITNLGKIAQGNSSVYLTKQMIQLAERIVLRALFSEDFNADVFDISDAIASDQILSVILGIFPTPSNLKRRRASKALDKAIYQIIDERRKHNIVKNDFLSMFMHAEEKRTGHQMGDKQLRDELITMILAGSETSGFALTWAIYLLAKNPDIARTLRDEIDRVVGSRPPTMADLQNLPLVEGVAMETIRLFPPVYIGGRVAVGNQQLRGFHIPNRSNVVLCQYVTHRHPDFWEEPEKFDPARFLQSDRSAPISAGYYPFGGGARNCIGQHFALLELQLVLTMLNQAFSFELESREEVTPKVVATLLQPPRDLRVIIRNRN